jgi:hypothetical protein
VSPILLGILDQGGAAVSGGTSYESIATVLVGSGGSSTISFTSISSTYKHLQLRWLSKNTSADYTIRCQFNGDTSTNYSQHGLNGDGSTAGAYGIGNDTNAPVGVSAGTATNVFGGGIIDILDYGSTSKYKTTRTLYGWDANGSGSVGLLSGSWRSTSAITSIVLSSFTGNFAQYSHFALYGVKD